MDVQAVAAFVAGFTAAEGTFGVSRSPHRKVFTFAVGLGATDAASCELLHLYFGCGSIVRSARRRAHYDDEVRFQVRRRADLIGRVVPFMDEHLPPSYKRRQYEAWRAELIAYDDRARPP